MRSLTIFVSRALAVAFIGAGVIFTRDPELGTALIFTGVVIWIIGSLFHWRLPRRKDHVVTVWGDKLMRGGKLTPYRYDSHSNLSMDAARRRMVGILKADPTFTVTKWEEVSG